MNEKCQQHPRHQWRQSGWKLSEALSRLDRQETRSKYNSEHSIIFFFSALSVGASMKQTFLFAGVYSFKRWKQFLFSISYNYSWSSVKDQIPTQLPFLFAFILSLSLANFFFFWQQSHKTLRFCWQRKGNFFIRFSLDVQHNKWFFRVNEHCKIIRHSKAFEIRQTL